MMIYSTARGSADTRSAPTPAGENMPRFAGGERIEHRRPTKWETRPKRRKAKRATICVSAAHGPGDARNQRMIFVGTL
jgi:hypothetical protein